MKKIMILSILFICFSSGQTFAAAISDYLILQDIDRYKVDQPVQFRGRILERSVSERYGNEAEYYYTSYQTSYSGGEGYAAPGVTIRVYDSTQWMLHELEGHHKRHKDKVATTTDAAAGQKSINGNIVLVYSISGNEYSWISDNKVISVKYHDSRFDYPEPIEVVQEYLKKYPSTFPSAYKFRKSGQNEIWIRDELDRLLWVADRWVSLVQEGDPKRKEKLIDAAEHLEEFAKYRKAYFSGLFSTNMPPDIELLQDARMRTDLETIVRTKLAEYKEWWASHKTDSISLP